MTVTRVWPLVFALAIAGCGKTESEADPEPPPQPETVTQPQPEREPTLVSVTWPSGDADKGRQVFVDHKCFSCHMVLLDDELMAMHEKAESMAAEHKGHNLAPGPHGKMAPGPHGKMAPGGEGDRAHGGAAHSQPKIPPATPHPSGHNKPPPLNAATLGKPPLILVKQMVIPGNNPADHDAHYGTYGEKLTLADVTQLAAFFRKVAKTIDDKPDAIPADDLDLLWPKGDAKLGNAVITERCNVCHGQGPARLEAKTRPRLVTVWEIAIATEHEPMLEKLTLRQVADVVEALTTSSP